MVGELCRDVCVERKKKQVTRRRVTGWRGKLEHKGVVQASCMGKEETNLAMHVGVQKERKRAALHKLVGACRMLEIPVHKHGDENHARDASGACSREKAIGLGRASRVGLEPKGLARQWAW